MFESKLENGLFYGIPCLVAVCLLFSATWPIALVVTVYWFVSFRVVGTTVRAAKTMFGKPYEVVESGLRWVPYAVCQLDERPTEIQSINIGEAGIVTKHGKSTDSQGQEIPGGRVYGSVVLVAGITVQFEYPEDNQLLKAVKKIPKDHEKIKDLLEEPVLDLVRTLGGDRVWIDIARKRAHFTDDIVNSLKPGGSHANSLVAKLLHEAGLGEVKVSVQHLTIPEDLKAALSAQERAELEKAGTLIAADAEKGRQIRVGEGVAKAKELLLNVIKGSPETMRAQALLTLIEMAQGQATTIFPLSTDLTNVLGQVLGRGQQTDVSAILSALTPQQREELVKTATRLMNAGGSK